MRRLLVALLLLTVACTSQAPTEEAEATPIYTRLDQGDIGPHRATFELRFEGSSSWTYTLETRIDGDVAEYQLHIEGVGAALNPGDVRMVVQGDVARMRGPGTRDECLQFPADLDLGLSFLTPDDMVDPRDLEGTLDPAEGEAIAGHQATHYSSRQEEVGDWGELEVDLWLDEETSALLRYELYATGPDPLFDAGEGTLNGQFLVSEIGPQAIEPVAGCEISVPLPPGASRLVKLPGLIAFDSTAASPEIVAFFQAELPAAGWEVVAEPETGTDAVLLQYRQSGQVLEVNVETSGEGVHVELLLGSE